MREIRFRGKDVENGVWVYGSLINNMFFKTDSKKPIPYIVDTYREDADYDSFDDMENLAIEVDPETVGQFTRKKDKNGADIYEADIVRQTYHAERGGYEPESFDGYHTGEIVISTSKGVCLRNPLWYCEETGDTEPMKQYKTVASYRSEVIGNIHDNPELIGI